MRESRPNITVLNSYTKYYNRHTCFLMKEKQKRSMRRRGSPPKHLLPGLHYGAGQKMVLPMPAKPLYSCRKGEESPEPAHLILLDEDDLAYHQIPA
jgi:hypothetical protein